MDSNDKKLRDFLLRGDRTFLPHISVDCVIFGFHDDQLKVLLLKWKDSGTWCVPGGFVKHDESLDESAKRTFQATGIFGGLNHQLLKGLSDPNVSHVREFTGLNITGEKLKILRAAGQALVAFRKNDFIYELFGQKHCFRKT